MELKDMAILKVRILLAAKFQSQKLGMPCNLKNIDRLTLRQNMLLLLHLKVSANAFVE